MITTRPDFRYKPPSEKETQRAVIRLFRAIGATVRSLSQYRASMVAIGSPDLLCHHRGIPASWWFETKPPLARWRDDHGIMVYFDPNRPATWKPRALDAAQAAFREDALGCGDRHFWGDLRAAEEAVIALGRGYRLPNGVLQIGVRRVG